MAGNPRAGTPGRLKKAVIIVAIIGLVVWILLLIRLLVPTL